MPDRRVLFGEGRLSQTLAVGVLVSLLAMPALAQEPAYLDGLTDRTTWESWLRNLSTDQQPGAQFWAANRSKHPPGDCSSDAAGLANPAVAACLEAKRMLDPMDGRRSKEPLYRAGFNAYQVPGGVKPPTPQPYAFPNPRVTRYRISQQITMGCPTANDAEAVAQMFRRGGYYSRMLAEGQAYGCLSAGKGTELELIERDSDTGAMLLRLPQPSFVLGRGKIEQLWFSGSVVEKAD